ncbi:hypothetical protein SFRURICE_000073, partial [Spodoptera frugiperda]
AGRSSATVSAGLRTTSKGSSSPEQNQTRACGASRSARASKSHHTTKGHLVADAESGAATQRLPVLEAERTGLHIIRIKHAKKQRNWGLSLLLQLCQNGRSLSSAIGMELYNLHSSVPLALLSDRPF